MKENTAMQELIEFEKELVRTKGNELTAYEIHMEVMEKAKELLKKERQNIVDAVDSTIRDIVSEKIEHSNGNDYFTNKYNTND